ncbi:nitrate ABC transporter ATP-binding protein [Candidatus Marsarchaeota G2 archaeon ECH_B_SAG-F08]|jgi:ABC-type nitrate/sulfonate/bicarbonate transport system, ATPase component|uniref:Nitrate ABC transporter ATP-binding protein n=3 Tax=Candidatus Marsarchaeota TaxID=1978152 RepID=A0A2R6BJP0_9ARCH|nr:MAG: nitrate ABC transporter ATP-binding protein [Candidatus Marsarchaeota G1 archaeon OSP_C]PSN98698.1 MAG: nitrate ABC transporter ATP-binding protein [Candidatus Marsarchaeota G2 archaeon ECH_B_SAG-F08]
MKKSLRVMALEQKTVSTFKQILKIEGISKSFVKDGKKVQVLEDVSFEVREGSFVSIIGPSGCGKTTLLRIIDGLVKPDSGKVLFNGELVTSPPPKMGFVFQQFGLLPWRTVRKNVEFGLELRGVNPEERKKIAERYIKLVGLEGFENHYPHELSGGMQQRVGLARALAIDPDVLLMDEPFASVDMQTRELLQRELLKIVKGALPKTTLFVTHNIDEAIYLSDEIVLMTARPGKVYEIIKVDLPQERWKEDIRAHPEFIRLRQKIWKFLESQIIEKEMGENESGKA